MSVRGTVFRKFASTRMGSRRPVAGAMHLLWHAGLLLPSMLLILALGMTLLLLLNPWQIEAVDTWLLTSVVAACIGLLLLLVQFERRLLKPLAALEDSIARINQGDPDALLPVGGSRVLDPMIQDLESLINELNELYEDMDSRIARHTTRLAQKTASLKILYDVAASINRGQDLDELLIRFLRVLKEMVNGLAATVLVVQEDGKMRLVGSIGMDDQLLKEHELLPVVLCQCGNALSPGDILCDNKARYCMTDLKRKMYTQEEVDLVSVPLDYHGDQLGVYNIFVLKPGVSQREDILQLLDTIGSHLGMAVAKQRSDEEARRLSVMRERNAMAHELHDSLAQTLASLRFQVRMLEDSLQPGTVCETAIDDLQRIRHGVDEAHTELRELLNSFRAPANGRGLTSALDKLVERFRSETGIATYFQQECDNIRLSAGEEMQMLRIVQESLANIRKHAQSKTVRVLLTCHQGAYVLLVEDDGVGFENTTRMGRPGEHIGLSIMEERANRLGAELNIESEPGEGTRVELNYAPEKKLRDVNNKWVM